MLDNRYCSLSLLYRSERTLVQRAVRSCDQVRVLLKSITSDFPETWEIELIQHEHALLKRLEGPGLPVVAGLEEDGARIVLVLLDEGHQSLQTGMQWEVGAFLDVAVAVVAIIERIHRHGVLHLDVNPSNIVRRQKDGDVRLIDFNVASDDPASIDTLRGTLPYLAPEQTGRTEHTIDVRSDLYALGITFFELMAGRKPFEEHDTPGWVHAHLSKTPPPLNSLRPGVPETLERMIHKLLQKEPDLRYQTATALYADLRRCRDEWSTDRAISLFELARLDERARLKTPTFLAERETWVDKVRHGLCGRVVVVSGAEGSGCSAVVKRALELREAPFRVLTDVCRQDAARAPLAVISECISKFFRRLLALPEHELSRWAERLRAETAPNTSVLVKILPDLAPVLSVSGGDIPEPPDSIHISQRNQAFVSLFGVLTREQPVVLHLEELQWADRDTLQLLEVLVFNPDLDRLTVVCTVRGRAVPERLLVATGDTCGSSQHIHLPPLSRSGVDALVTEVLGETVGSRDQLIDILYDKTGGHPGVIVEVLRSQQDTGALQFRAQGWEWDLQAFRDLSKSDSVLDLAVARFETLSSDERFVLGLAACLSSPFQADELRLLAGSPAPWVIDVPIARVLDHALDLALLQRVANDSLIFEHDRLREAAASALEGDVRARAHLRVARNLVAKHGPNLDTPTLDTHIFTVCEHFEHAGAAIETSADGELAYTMHRRAATLAMRSAGYAIALHHLDCALALRSEETWTKEPANHFEILLERARNAYAIGEMEAVAAGIELLLQRAPDAFGRATVHRLDAAVASQQGRMKEVLDITRCGLAELGVVIPKEAADVQAAVGASLSRLHGHLEACPPEQLVDLPVMTDFEKILAIDLLLQAIPAAFQTNPPLYLVIELTVFDLSVTSGLTPSSAKSIAGAGIIAANLLDDFATAVRLGDASLAVVERFAPHPIESSVCFINGAFLHHLRDDPDICLGLLERAYRCGNELGDVEHAAYANVYVVSYLQVLGQPLEMQRTAALDAGAYSRRVESVMTLLISTLLEISASILLGLERIDDRLISFQEEVEKDNSGPTSGTHLIQVELGVISWWQGDIEAAWRYLEAAAIHAQLGKGLCNEVRFHFYTVLSGAAMFVGLSGVEREGVLQKMSAAADRLAALEAANPLIHGPFSLLARGELARCRGAPLEEIIDLYDAAVAAAGNRYLQIRGAAFELHSRLWEQRGQKQLAKTLFREAYQLYSRWGCRVRTTLLEERHAAWCVRDALTEGTVIGKSTATSTVMGASIDLESVIKATRAVASEITADGLFSALMRTIIENAGAQFGCLVTFEPGGHSFVDARMRADNEADLQRGSLEQASGIAHSVIAYASRSMEIVVIPDARQDPRFSSDAHILHAKVRSVMCVPIVQRGELFGVLYLENNALTGAFTPQHVVLLKVVAGQAAVSLQNVRVFESLERRVAERTVELAARTREIEALFDHLPQAVVTFDSSLEIEPRYSALAPEVLDCDDLAGRNVLEVLLDKSSIDDDQRDLCQAALGCSFGISRFMASANWHHLVRHCRWDVDGHIRYLSIDWAPIVDEQDDIVRMVVTVRDVTEFEELERQAREATEELEITHQILAVGVSSFRSFIDTERARLASVYMSLGPTKCTDLEGLARAVHTLKGNARMLGLGILAAVAHRAEEPISQLRNEIANVSVVELREAVDSIVEGIESHERILAAALGKDIGKMEEQLRELRAIVQAAGADHARQRAAFRQIQELLWQTGMTKWTVHQVVTEASHMLPSLAAELDKPVPGVSVAGPKTPITEQFYGALRDAMVHVFRNALDHGIEPAACRIEVGKPSAGHIEVNLEPTSSGVRCCIQDDGRGLALARLRAQMPDPSNDEAVANSIFLSGRTTAPKVTTISGRGIGMDAVRMFLRSHGCEVSLVFTGLEQDGYRPFALQMDLPFGVLDLQSLHVESMPHKEEPLVVT